ncbi:HNH endonuclease signature motif containing protein, partial [Glycomyces tarimensis]
VQWTEAHHIRHWANGGPTVAENLVLLCRFHHGRIHTPGWSITKTRPGKALIVHHEGHEDTDPDLKCGCSDWRTDTDLDADFADDIANAFPTGLYPEEWSETLKPDLEAAAEQADLEDALAAAKAARAKARARFTTPAPDPATEPEPASAPAPEPEPEPGYETSTPLTEPRRACDLVSAAPAPDYGPPPVLTRPLRYAVAGKALHKRPARNRTPGSSPFPCPTPRTAPPATRIPAAQPAPIRPGTALPTTSATTSRHHPARHRFCRRYSAERPSLTPVPANDPASIAGLNRHPRRATSALTPASDPDRPATSPSPPQRRVSIHKLVPASAWAAMAGLTRRWPPSFAALSVGSRIIRCEELH